MTQALTAPFPYFGGKRRVADLVWDRLGRDVSNYVEPFAGSLAVLLGRGCIGKTETVNDLDGLLVNAWRGIKLHPDAVAEHADWPVSECDLHARHLALIAQREELTDRLMTDPDFCDVRLAAWWIWGACCWIGSGWCSRAAAQVPSIGGTRGRGIHSSTNRGADRRAGLRAWFGFLAERLAEVDIVCGNWMRVLVPGITFARLPIGKGGPIVTSVLLDPPYGGDWQHDSYAEDGVWADVTAWCEEHGDNPNLRIALCGYDGTWTAPDGWDCVPWKARGGYGSQGNGQGRENSGKERIWFSPACLSDAQGSLFGGAA